MLKSKKNVFLAPIWNESGHSLSRKSELHITVRIGSPVSHYHYFCTISFRKTTTFVANSLTRQLIWQSWPTRQVLDGLALKCGSASSVPLLTAQLVTSAQMLLFCASWHTSHGSVKIVAQLLSFCTIYSDFCCSCPPGTSKRRAVKVSSDAHKCARQRIASGQSVKTHTKIIIQMLCVLWMHLQGNYICYYQVWTSPQYNDNTFFWWESV